MKTIFSGFFFLFFTVSVVAQETNSNFHGLVKSEKGELLNGATITAVHEPTQNTFVVSSNAIGIFHFFNAKPGGPYTITASFVGYKSVTKKDVFLGFNSAYTDDNNVFILALNTNNLQDVIVAVRKANTFSVSETNINNQQLSSLPSINRNLQDFVRLIPQAKVNADGMMSLAGQNNKFNAFFIDGSNQNDILGLASSGAIGGQTGSPPISIEAIEELKVLQSPFDVQYGNFTGASINAITKSGSNQFKSSTWYYTRNEKMAGRSPVPLEKPGSPGVYERSRLSNFLNQTIGLSASGPFIKNNLFYFLLVEKQTEKQPQPYNFSDYLGSSSQQQILALADTMRTRYGYEPGSFLETKNELIATRFITKLDWNPGISNKLTLSYRYNNAERISPAAQNSRTVIRFSNNRVALQSQNHSVSFEWKKYFKSNVSNRLLVTYNNELTDKKIIGQPFPVVIVNDGAAAITLGSNGSSQLNLFKATDITLLNTVKFTKNKHAFNAGIDINVIKIRDIALGSYYGQYQYRNINDFITGSFAFRYQRNVSLVDKPANDNTNAAAIFNTQRSSAFFSDDITVNTNFKLTLGIRLDGNSLPVNYKPDVYFNTVMRPVIEKYYSLDGALSGRLMKTHWQVSPRIGFDYNIPEEKVTVRGGAGVFTGHIINLWASEIYSVNSALIDIVPQLYGLRFNPDPFTQPDFQSLGINPENVKGTISLVTRNYKYPTIFRTSLEFEKKLSQGWSLITQLMFTKNIHETKYTNVNLLPATQMTASPDSRYVYSLNTAPERLPVAGGNPYNGIILLGNNEGSKGYSYSFTAIVNKSFTGKIQFTTAYTYGNSVALFEPTGTSNTTVGQWSTLETVNGRNRGPLSVSDFDIGHRIIASVIKRISYCKNKMSTTITAFYNGQSGSPYSYVYAGSITNDNGRISNTDLIYIPTFTELVSMNFVPYTVNAITYSAQKQKELLNDFIEHDDYLRKRRGQFAERNGARLPFTQTIDIRLQQDFIFQSKKGKKTTVSIIYDVFNFTNMINKNWGRTYSLTNDNFQLIRFVGFSNLSTLTPQYQFSPITGKVYNIQNSTAPGNSARWISQLGIRLNFY